MHCLEIYCILLLNCTSNLRGELGVCVYDIILPNFESGILGLEAGQRTLCSVRQEEVLSGITVSIDKRKKSIILRICCHHLKKKNSSDMDVFRGSSSCCFCFLYQLTSCSREIEKRKKVMATHAEEASWSQWTVIWSRDKVLAVSG